MSTGSNTKSTSLPHAPLTALHRVEEHVRAEYGNQVPEIMPTVSTWDVHFALLSTSSSGLDLVMATDTAQAREYYEGTRREWSIVTSHHLKEVNAPWYSFHDSVGVIRMVEGGEVRRGRTAILFPVWLDGIIGEVVWSRPEGAGLAGPGLQAAELRVGELHDEFVRAWREGDLEALLAVVEDDSCTVVRTAEVGGGRRTLAVARGKAELRDLLAMPDTGRVRDLERTGLVLSDWYAFAEYRMDVELPRRRVERHLAALYPVGPGGRLVGQLAYGFDLA